MKKILFIFLAFIAVACVHTSESAEPISRSIDKEIVPSATIKMAISREHAKMYFGTLLPEFEVVIDTQTYKSEGFVQKDDHYEASVYYPCSKRCLETVTLSLTDKDKISLTLHCVPLDPEEPTVLDFELFLCNVDFNITVDPSFNGNNNM